MLILFLSEFREAFRLFDKDGDGSITQEELGRVMRSLGQFAREEELQQMLHEVDIDGDGNVSFEEFVEIVSNMGAATDRTADQEEKELRDAFRVFDKHNRGYISASDLRAVLQCLGEDLSEEEIEDMIKEVDVDGDGRIDFYVRIGAEISEGSEIGRGVRQGCPLSPTLFNIYLEDLVKNYFQNMGGVIVRGRRIKCIRFDDDMALLAKEEMILRDMLLELNDSCEQYGMKINTNNTKTMVLGRKIQKINLRILNEAVEMEFVKWADRIRNEAVLERVGEERIIILKLIRKRKMNWLGHWVRRNCLLKDALEGIVNGRRVR
ncbi:hypothetical protein ANN_26447 [Periplaneta americana]|uniref:Calmodulin n=1 Tax=Periplaneta americana TaxID=6978 RepID=A0ABQ8RYC4_PERAM|nr:hypothetical protein ANN_26447 [Periplaneta americana]